MDVIRALFEKRIIWHSTEPGGEGPEYYAYIDGAKCEICMNDFPDEPLFTLRFQGQSLYIDSRPATWVFPFDQDR